MSCISFKNRMRLVGIALAVIVSMGMRVKRSSNTIDAVGGRIQGQDTRALLKKVDTFPEKVQAVKDTFSEKVQEMKVLLTKVDEPQDKCKSLLARLVASCPKNNETCPGSCAQILLEAKTCVGHDVDEDPSRRNVSPRASQKFDLSTFLHVLSMSRLEKSSLWYCVVQREPVLNLKELVPEKLLLSGSPELLIRQLRTEFSVNSDEDLETHHIRLASRDGKTVRFDALGLSHFRSESMRAMKEVSCNDAVQGLRTSRLSVCSFAATSGECQSQCQNVIDAVASHCRGNTFTDNDGTIRSISDVWVQEYLAHALPPPCVCHLQKNVFGDTASCGQASQDVEFAPFASCGYLAVLLLLGFVLRCKFSLLRKLFMPCSLIAGLLGFTIKYGMLYLKPSVGQWIESSWMYGWEGFGGFLINVIFATIFIGADMPSARDIWYKGGPQLCYGELHFMGQYSIGIGLSLLLVAAGFDIPAFFGYNLPMAFVGGHGNCFAVEEAYVFLGWEAGKDVCLMTASVGQVGGVVIGVLCVNILRLLGKMAPATESSTSLTVEEQEEEHITSTASEDKAWISLGIVPRKKRESGASLATNSDAVESMAIQAAIVFLTVFLAYAIARLLVAFELQCTGWAVQLDARGVAVLPSILRPIGALKIFSLFPFFSLNLLTGMMTTSILKAFGVDFLIDRPSIDRIAGFSLEVLLTSSIASVDVSGALDSLGPLLLMIFSGFMFNLFLLFFVAPRVFVDYPYHRGFFEFGTCSGTTPTGLLLLNMADSKTPKVVYEAISMRLMVDCPLIGLFMMVAMQVLVLAGAKALLALSLGMFVFWSLLLVTCFSPTKLAAMKALEGPDSRASAL